MNKILDTLFPKRLNARNSAAAAVAAQKQKRTLRDNANEAVVRILEQVRILIDLRLASGIFPAFQPNETVTFTDGVYSYMLNEQWRKYVQRCLEVEGVGMMNSPYFLELHDKHWQLIIPLVKGLPLESLQLHDEI